MGSPDAHTRRTFAPPFTTVVFLELLGVLEAIYKTAIVISGGLQLGLPCQFPNPFLVFRNGLVQPFESGVDTNDLAVSGRELCRSLLLGRRRQPGEDVACLFQPGDMAVSDLVCLRTQRRHPLGQVAFGRQHLSHLPYDIAGSLGPLPQRFRLLLDAVEIFLDYVRQMPLTMQSRKIGLVFGELHLNPGQ